MFTVQFNVSLIPAPSAHHSTQRRLPLTHLGTQETATEVQIERENGNGRRKGSIETENAGAIGGEAWRRRTILIVVLVRLGAGDQQRRGKCPQHNLLRIEARLQVQDWKEDGREALQAPRRRERAIEKVVTSVGDLLQTRT